MLATGFLAVDFTVVGSLIKTAETDWYVTVLAGALATGYLVSVFLVIDRPDEPVDDPNGASRSGPATDHAAHSA